MDELLEQFVIEGRELVAQATGDLLAMERSGYDAARTSSAFRAIHTLKGSAGLFDMAPLGRVLHAAEDLMAALREAASAPAREAMTALLSCMDYAEAGIESVARHGALPPDAAVRAQALAQALRAPLAGDASASGSAPDAPEQSWLHALLAEGAGEARSALRYVPAPGCFFLGDDPLALVRQIPELLALRIGPRAPWSLPDYDPFACNLEILALSAAPAAVLGGVFRFVPDQATVVEVAAAPAPSEPAGATPAEAAGRQLRVAAGQVDGLAGLVDELFAAKNRLAHVAEAAGSPALSRALAETEAELGRLAGLMHRAVTGMRLVKLDQTLRRLPRLVREVAVSLGRDVRFSIEGADVQADKATVDALFEPLLHLVRNAVDHGIEPPAARVAAGKPAQGLVALRAALEGAQVVITLSDDGAGLDATLLRRLAATRGVAEPAALESMDDAAVHDLIFLPGFSTASRVTDTSGRGVGMDAVRAAVQAMGGQVGIAPAPRGGTVVRLAVPQTAAILTVVAVQAGGGMFGIPIGDIAETARVARAAIMPLQAGRAFVLRDQTIPLVGLAGLLGMAAPGEAASGLAPATVVICGLDGHPVGLEVDGLGARMEVVLRPLPALLAATPGLRGSALLGDGAVLLVLDVAGLLR